MNKIYISFLSICVSLAMNAQLTQANHAPVPSYTYAMYHCDSVNTDAGFSGANVLWDYSAIETFTDLVTDFSAAAANNTVFPNAQVLLSSSQGMNYYYSSTATDLTLHGGNIAFSGAGANLQYTSVAVVAAYPMGLNTSTSSVTGGNISVTVAQIPVPLAGTFTGNSHVIADGSGTLILPGANATFTNALRVVTSQTLNATLAGQIPILGTIAATATITITNYDFYSIGTHHALFSMQVVDVNVYADGFGTLPFSQTSVLRDVITGIAVSTPTANFSLSSNTICISNSVTVSNNSSGAPTLSYTWSSSDNSNVNFSPNNTAATPSISFSSAGTYTITLTAADEGGTHSFSRTVVVSECVGIDKLNDERLELSVYPNPASAFVNFSTESQNAASLVLYDITGKTVKEISFSNGSANLNVAEVNMGLYIYKVKAENGNTLKMGKVIVNH